MTDLQTSEGGTTPYTVLTVQRNTEKKNVHFKWFFNTSAEYHIQP
jgi:hypothetical protein